MRVFTKALGILSIALTLVGAAQAESAWVRVSQVGYEADGATARAYLMSTKPEEGATFRVLDQHGSVAYSNVVAKLVGTWGHSPTLTYQVYALDFRVPTGEHYKIAVTGPVPAESPVFAVEPASVLYPGLLLNSLFFYQTERDGADYIPNALRTGPGHLKDRNAKRYVSPPLDEDANINYVPPAGPLEPAGLPNIDAEGGWWDAGDYMKYVVTISYTVAMMETGVRDFGRQMGAEAPWHPAAPPNSVSYAGSSGPGAPARADYTGEAKRGVEWLLKMWDAKTKTLSYQVDNSQEWNYYGQGDTASTAGYCGGIYPSPYCLITEYDIWTLPQAGDDFEQDGDPQPCDPLTTYFICNRPVYTAGPPRSKIVPNIAGRMTAVFALCYQLHRRDDPALAERCLRTAEEIYSYADLSHPDPAPDSGPGKLVSSVPSYPEQAWDDDMEWGATELALALESAGGAERLPKGLPIKDARNYLKDATHFAARYVALIDRKGYAETLNLYDVSGLAHFELFRALVEGRAVTGLELSALQVRRQLLHQVEEALDQGQKDPFNFGVPWNIGDIPSFGAGLSVMASEAYALSLDPKYTVAAQRWQADIFGANAWGSSFIVGDGSTFPNCIQHQVANIAGSLHGTSGGTPVLWGAAAEGPSLDQSSGLLDGLRLCPANGVDTFARFNGNSGAYDPNNYVQYKDDAQSYTTTEPTLDITASSFLMWSWRLAEAPRW